VSVREILRTEPAGEARLSHLKETIRAAAEAKPEGHCFADPAAVTETQVMAQIGG